VSDNLHDPRPIQEALAPHAKRLREHACASCGGTGDGDFDDGRPAFYVLPVSNGVHATPQLTPLCNGCAMEIAETLSEMHDP